MIHITNATVATVVSMNIKHQTTNDFHEATTATPTTTITRPDTWPPVADGWAGAEMSVFPLFNSSVTDRRTNQPTDGRTKSLIELRVLN